MSNDDFQLLLRAQAIIARMPRQFSSTRAALVLQRAAESNAAEAQALLLSAGVLDIAAVLAGAAYTLRSTGHFESAQALDAFAARVGVWERRNLPRQGRESKDGSGAA